MIDLFPELGAIAPFFNEDLYLIPSWKIVASDYSEAVEFMLLALEDKGINLYLDFQWKDFCRGRYQDFYDSISLKQTLGCYLSIKKIHYPVLGVVTLGLFEVLSCVYLNKSLLENTIVTSDWCHDQITIREKSIRPEMYPQSSVGLGVFKKGYL